VVRQHEMMSYVFADVHEHHRCYYVKIVYSGSPDVETLYMRKTQDGILLKGKRVIASLNCGLTTVNTKTSINVMRDSSRRFKI